MKKTSKLLAFIIVFSMILSTMVMPVSVGAAGELFVKTIDFTETPDFTVKNTTANYGKLWFAADTLASFEHVTDPKDSSNKVVKVTVKDAAKVANSGGYYTTNFHGFVIPTANQTEGSYYFVAADILEAEDAAALPSGSKSAYMRASCTSNATAYKSVSIGADTWRTSRAITNNNGVSGWDKIYFQVPTNSKSRAFDHYVDNYRIHEIRALNTTELETAGTFKLTGPADLGLDKNYITITKSGETTGVNPTAVAYDSTEGVWNISYSGLDMKSSYQVMITRVFVGTTEGHSDLLNSSGYDKRMYFNFTTKDPNILKNLTTLLYQNPVADEELSKDTTDTDAWVLDRTAGGVQGALAKVALTDGMVYEFKASVKKAAPSADDTTVKMYLYGDYGTDREELLNVPLTVTDEYQEFTGTFKVTGQAGEAKHHIGLLASEGTDNLLIKDFQLLEVAKFTAVGNATPATDAAEITFDFSAAPAADLAGADLIISGGSARVVDIIGSDKTYTVQLEDLRELTEYTVELASSVKDDYGQSVECAPVVFTTEEPVPTPLKNYKSANWLVFSTSTLTKVGDFAVSGTGSFRYNACLLDEPYELSDTSDLPEEPTKVKYLVSAYFRDGNLADGNSPKVTSLHLGHSCYEYTTTPLNCTNLVLGEDWVKATWIIEIGTAEAAATESLESGYCRTPSHRASKLRRAGGTHDANAHLGFTVATEEGDVVEFRDFAVTKYIPFDIESIGLKDGDMNVDTEANINVTFSSKPYKFLSNNIIVKDAEGNTVANAATTKKIDDTNYVISLSGLATGQKYTIKFNDVQDMYAQGLEWNASFITAVTSNLITKSGYNAGFENQLAPATLIGDATRADIVPQESDFSAAPTQGDYQLKLSKLADGDGFYFAGIGATGEQVQLEPGKTYELTFDVRAVPGTGGSVASGSVTPFFENINAETNTIVISETDAATVAVDSTEWTTVTSTVTISENAEGSLYEGINVGLKATGLKAIYADNFDLREVIPSFTMRSSVAYGEEKATTNEVILTFTNAPAAFDETNITSTSDVTVEKLSDKKYKVTVGEFANNTSYSFTVNDVLDAYGQRVTDEKISFKTASAPSYNEGNILDGDAAIDANFEATYPTSAGKLFPGANYSSTVNGVTTWCQETLEVVSAEAEGITLPDESYGTQVLKITKSETPDGMIGVHRYANYKNVEIGKRYEISYMARTVNEGETAKLSMDYSQSYPTVNTMIPQKVSQNDFEVTNEWTKVYAVFDIVPNPGITGTPVNWGFHFGARSKSEVSFYVDKYEIREIKTDFIVSTTFENKQSGMPTDGITIPVKFSNSPWGVDESNVQLSATRLGESVPANASVQIEKVDALNYNIILSDLELKTTYTVDLTGVIDVYGAGPIEGGAFTPITFTTNFGEGVPEFTLVTNPESGALSHDTEIVTLTFTNAPVSFVKDTNVTITMDGAPVEFTVNTVAANEATDEFIYTLNITEPVHNKEYTVYVNVLDIDDQAIEKTIVFKTCAGDPVIDNNIMNNGLSNNGFERSPLGGYTGHSGNGMVSAGIGGGTFSIVGEDNGVTPYEGSQMLKAVGPSGSYAIRFANFTGVEIGKQYMVSYYVRTVNEGETVKASVYVSRSGITTNTMLVSTASAKTVTVDNEWKKVSAIVDVTANPDIDVETPVNQGFHFGANCKGVDIYLDNFEVLEIPKAAFAVSSSTPANNAKQVKIDMNQIVINYSHGINKNFDPAVEGEFKLYKGDVDVTADVIAEGGIVTSFAKGAILFNIKPGVVLDNGATYKVVANGVVDYLDRTVDSEIIFTTAPAIVSETPVIAAVGTNGQPVAASAIKTASQGVNEVESVNTATIEFTNYGSGAVNNPLYIYTLYDGDTLVKSGSTVFDNASSLPQYGTATLSFDLQTELTSVGDLTGMRLTLYLVNAFDSLFLAAEPIVFDFVAP